jgi:hypothetical protein
MTKANLFNLVGRHSMARDMVNSIVRPDQLANSHGAILSLANVDRYATFMAGAKQALPREVRDPTIRLAMRCEHRYTICTCDPIFIKARQFGECIGAENMISHRWHWGTAEIDRSKQRQHRKAWLYLCFLCYLLFNFCSHLCASAPQHELPSARFRDLLTRSASSEFGSPPGWCSDSFGRGMHDDSQPVAVLHIVHNLHTGNVIQRLVNKPVTSNSATGKNRCIPA